MRFTATIDYDKPPLQIDVEADYAACTISKGKSKITLQWDEIVGMIQFLKANYHGDDLLG